MVSIVVSASCALADSTLSLPAPKDKLDPLKVVKSYADAMIEHGRDRYGKKKTPLFASALNLKTMSLFEGEELKARIKMPRDHWDIRWGDRNPAGANPMYDENLYQILYALTEITGDAKYKTAADDALRYFFKECSHPQSGLLPWGEHMSQNLLTDSAPPGIHEFGRPWVLWNQCYRLAPEESASFAMGLWESQIRRKGDSVIGYSRHASWSGGRPGKGAEYPRHGGFYIASWATAYRDTQKQEYLVPIESLLAYFESKSSPESKAIPKDSWDKVAWPESNLSLAIDLWDSAAMVPDGLAKKMRARASATDEVFLKVAHDLRTDGAGFISACDLHTLKPKAGGKGLWAGGYGGGSLAGTANNCMLRYRQIKDDRYKDLILKAGKCYVGGDVPSTYHNHKHGKEFSLNPGALGSTIYLMLNCHELSGEKFYLDEARRFANSVSLFMKGDAPLPIANVHPSLHHYESCTAADTLMMSLLRLWVVENSRELQSPLVFTDR